MDIVCEECAEIVRELFLSEEARSAFVEMWATIANRYKMHQKITGHDLLVEPHKPHLPDDVRAQCGDVDLFRKRWPEIAQRIVNRIEVIRANSSRITRKDIAESFC